MAQTRTQRSQAARKAAAVEAATPHLQTAESERAKAMALGKPLRELEFALSNASNGDKEMG